jgi:hypothetical protein
MLTACCDPNMQFGNARFCAEEIRYVVLACKSRDNELSPAITLLNFQSRQMQQDSFHPPLRRDALQKAECGESTSCPEVPSCNNS